jgi:hypothetical protein
MGVRVSRAPEKFSFLLRRPDMECVLVFRRRKSSSDDRGNLNLLDAVFRAEGSRLEIAIEPILLTQ